jgi:integrase
MSKSLANETTKTYNKMINKLKKDMNIKNNNYFINNFDNVIKYIKDNYPNIGSQITLISSIMYILNNDDTLYNIFVNDYIQKYRELLNENRLIIQNNKKDNKKNDKEQKNWISLIELHHIFRQNYNKIKDILLNKVNYILNEELFNQIQNTVLLSLYIMMEPRRSEYIKLKYKNYDINKDNYIDIINKKMGLNQYKTDKKYDKFEIDLNKKIYEILNNYINFKIRNKLDISDYLFTTFNNKNIDNSQLAKRLNKIIGKNISVSMIRKIYLSDIYGDDLNQIKKLSNTSKNMGNSINTIINNYIKK